MRDGRRTSFLSVRVARGEGWRPATLRGGGGVGVGVGLEEAGLGERVHGDGGVVGGAAVAVAEVLETSDVLAEDVGLEVDEGARLEGV